MRHHTSHSGRAYLPKHIQTIRDAMVKAYGAELSHLAQYR